MGPFVPVMQLCELPRGRMRACVVAGREILICHTRAGVFALDNICTRILAGAIEVGLGP